MRDDELDQLPEAVPLYRIAPWWRPLAVLALLGVLGLLAVALVLAIALVEMENRQKAAWMSATPGPPPTMAFPPPAGGVGLAAADADQTDPQNLPYPVEADLAVVDPYAVVEDNPQAATARQRFLDLGTDLWKLKNHLPEQLAVSPDGQRLAYIVDNKLTAGPIGAQRQVVDTVTRQVPVPVPGMPGRPVYAASVAQVVDIQLLGPVTWSPDSPYVYCADHDGRLRRYDVESHLTNGQGGQVLPFEGDSPAPVPTEPEKLVFVRAQPRPKLEVPTAASVPDLSEVVLGDLTTQEVRVLVPAGISSYRHLAVSPDGKRLALVSDRGHEGKRAQHLRVFVLDMAGGELKPLTPPAAQVGPVCWTPDNQALIYARSREPLPPDYWEDEPNGPNGAVDLYQWDFAANRETRLSRGGGCFSPSVSAKDELYYLAVDEAGSSLLLRRMPLAAAHEFAAREPQPAARDAEAWTELFHQVLEKCHIVANLNATALTPQTTATLTETFNNLYRERFKSEPPATLKAFDRQRRELERLDLSPELYPHLTLLVGALEGEYLVRRHRARWHLSGGPLLPIEATAARATVESAFAYVVNPFALASAWARRAVHLPYRSDTAGAESLLSLLGRTDGRTLVLSNDSAAAQAAVRELTDPELGRGRELLEQGQAEEGEQVLEKMLKQERHEKNLYLNLHIGKLLYEHNRHAALERIMEHQCDLPPRDARKFNLLGVASLNAQPQQAINAFKSALRCDLRFEAAYLNLAQAYQRANDLQSARLCLRRYLAILPDGIYAADARRRLAAVETDGN